MSITLNRDSVLAEVQRLLSKSPFSKEDSSKAERLMQLADTLSPGANELRKLRLAESAAELGISDPANAGRYRTVEGVRELTQVEQDFNTAIRFGIEHVQSERRALAVGTGQAGGFLVPQAFSNSLWSTLKAYDPLLDPDVVHLIEAGSGAEMAVPIVDDGTGAAVIVGENTQIAETPELTFAQGLIPAAAKWTCPHIRVSRELVQDSQFALSDFLAAAFGVRLARGIGASFITNLLGAATLGATCPSGSVSTIPYDSLVDLVGSIDPAYQASPKVGWLMRFATLIALFKLKASTGGEPMLTFDAGRFMLFGKPVYICPSMPALAASAKTVIFGDLSRFAVRAVRDAVTIRPYLERYAEYGQVGYSASMRLSAALIKATGSDSPLKYLQQAAS